MWGPVLAADSDPGAATPSAAARVAPDAPRPGGSLVTAMTGDATNLLPGLATDSASSEISSNLFVAPLRYDKDLNVEAWAAESFEVQDDGRLLRFALRPGIRWYDGVELTAEDVEFTYKTMIDPKTPTAYGEDFKVVKEFRVTGRYSFEVRYERAYARAVSTWMSSILPKHALEKEDLMTTAQARDPMGCGPYKLARWESGSVIEMTANQDFFEARPNLDRVVYRIIPDSATTFLELKGRHVDMMSLTPQQYLRQTVGPTWERDYRKYKYLSFAYTYLGYNLGLPMFADKRVRQALDFAIDKGEIVGGVLLGQGEPTIGPFVPGTWVYNTDIVPNAYDPQKALALFAEAGWRQDAAGVLRNQAGEPFAFTVLTNQGNDLRAKTATIIQYRLRQIGIQVKIRTIEWASFIKEFVNKGRFEAVLLGWTVPQDPDLFDIFGSSGAKPGGLNFVGYKNPEVDELLEKGRFSLDRQERKRIYDRVQAILHEDQPYCFLYVPSALPIVTARIRGIEPAPAGITYNFIHWWSDPSRSRVSAR